MTWDWEGEEVDQVRALQTPDVRDIPPFVTGIFRSVTPAKYMPVAPRPAECPDKTAPSWPLPNFSQLVQTDCHKSLQPSRRIYRQTTLVSNPVRFSRGGPSTDCTSPDFSKYGTKGAYRRGGILFADRHSTVYPHGNAFRGSRIAEPLSVACEAQRRGESYAKVRRSVSNG